MEIHTGGKGIFLWLTAYQTEQDVQMSGPPVPGKQVCAILFSQVHLHLSDTCTWDPEAEAQPGHSPAGRPVPLSILSSSVRVSPADQE